MVSRPPPRDVIKLIVLSTKSAVLCIAVFAVWMVADLLSRLKLLTLPSAVEARKLLGNGVCCDKVL